MTSLNWVDEIIREMEVRAALGMLLEAVWSSEHEVFVKITKSTHPNGIASHWETFYNEVGEEVPRPKGYQSA